MKTKIVVLVVLVLSLVLTACGGAKPAVPDTNALSTQIAATVNAAFNSVPTIPAVGNVDALATNVAATVAAALNNVPPAATKAPIAPPPAATKAPNPPTNSGSGASFSPITFSIGENKEEPVDALTTFPGGVTMIYAIFSGVNIKDGQAWSSEWYYNGELQSNLSDSTTWDSATAGPNQVWWLTVYNAKGVRSGTWELKLYIDGQEVQSGQATIEDNVEPDFGPITFAENVDKSDNPVNPVDVSDPTFPAGTKEVYAFFNGINVPKGTDWQTQWYLNGQPQDSKDHTWNFGPNELDWLQFGSDTALDAGTYELHLSINGKVVNIGSFIVAAQ